MIELTAIPIQTTPATTGTAAPGGAAAGFVQLLSTFLDATEGGTPDATATTAAGKRHGLADDGKSLPAGKGDDEKDDDKDAALLWLPAGLSQPVPLPVAQKTLPQILPPVGARTAKAGEIAPAATSGAAAAKAALLADAHAAGAQATRGDEAAPTAPESLAGANVSVATTPTPFPAPLLPAKAATAAASDAASAPPGKTADDKTAAPPPLVAPQPDQAPRPIVQSAGQAFAAAISAATSQARSVRDGDRHDGDSAGASTQLATAPADTANKPVVQGVEGTRHQALNLRDDSGLQGMIDRIETLRDDANARDTRIRLIPDALGSVDIAVRKEGDSVNVHFTAENQATRTLLADAQPRLAELAEARGVKIGQTSVNTGTGGNAQQQQQRAEAPRAPVSARSGATPDDSIMTDQRLA